MIHQVIAETKSAFLMKAFPMILEFPWRANENKSLYHCLLTSLVSMSKAMCLYSRLVEESIVDDDFLCKKATEVCPSAFADK